MATAPTLAELADHAGRALSGLSDPGQVVVLWERRLADGRAIDSLTATVTVVHDGRAGLAVTKRLDDEHLRRVARAAGLHARQARAWPAPALPEPVPARPHDGFDAALLDVDPAEALADAHAAAGDGGLDVDWHAGLARIAVASTTGVRASEERSHVVARVRGTDGAQDAEAVRGGGGGADVAGAATEVRALLGSSDPDDRLVTTVPSGATAEPPAGELPIVLGPQAVAAVLDRLRAAAGVQLALGDGPLAGRRGQRVAAAAVNLSDSARYPGTLPRSFDAEGVPRRPVPIIQDGVAHGAVHDSASAARAGAGATSTGHATRPLTLAPYPEQLVLVGGGAADVGALSAPVPRGLYLPTLTPADDGSHDAPGAALIVDGECVAALPGVRVAVDPLGVLAAVEALSADQRLVPLRGHCPGGIGAAVVPALRAGAGVRIA